jgi:hypothetical protein
MHEKESRTTSAPAEHKKGAGRDDDEHFFAKFFLAALFSRGFATLAAVCGFFIVGLFLIFRRIGHGRTPYNGGAFGKGYRFSSSVLTD